MEKHYPEWTRTIVTVLNDNWNNELSLCWLAQQVSLHPVTLSKYFRCTLGDYIRKLRIEHALNLVRQRNLSLTDIAYHCGFSDQPHLIRTFHSLTGMLPKKYRNL